MPDLTVTEFTADDGEHCRAVALAGSLTLEYHDDPDDTVRVEVTDPTALVELLVAVAAAVVQSNRESLHPNTLARLDNVVAALDRAAV